MTIDWLKSAIHDIETHHTYIASNNPIAANKVVQYIRDSVNVLPAIPSLGRPGRVPQTRELVLTECPFIVIYREQKKTIQILKVMYILRVWPD